MGGHYDFVPLVISIIQNSSVLNLHFREFTVPFLWISLLGIRMDFSHHVRIVGCVWIRLSSITHCQSLLVFYGVLMELCQAPSPLAQSCLELWL